MKKLFVSAVVISGALISKMGFADCAEPANVSLPDGATATTEQMVEGQRAVKEYIAAGEVFLACMEEAEKTNAETLTEEEMKANVERYNAVVDQMQLTAQGFNDQIKAYKAAQAEQ